MTFEEKLLSIDPNCTFEAKGAEAAHVIALLQAEAEERLVVLPVRIGDKLWRVTHALSRSGTPYKFIVPVKLNRHNLYRICFEGEWMRVVFPTREQAKAALEAD